MKKAILLILLILGFYQVTAQLPSNCNVPPVLRSYYEPDVKDMALKWLYSIKSADTSLIDIPQWCQDTIWGGLAAIYNRHDLPEVDSVFNKYCVHIPIDFGAVSVIFREIVVDLDTSYNWTNNWMNLQTTTGIPALDTLLAKYGFTVTNTSHSYSNNPYVLLTTTQYINVSPFCDSLESFQGIISAYPNTYFSTGPLNIIQFSDTGNVKYYRFSFAWGAEVGFHHAWRYKVNPDCSIEFLGNEVGCGSGWGSHPHLPEPVNCNILDIPRIVISDQEVEVYPNPANDLVMISVNSPGVYSFRIIDCFGKTCLSGNGKEKCHISLTGLSPGLYLVYLLRDTSLIGTVKLVKEK